MSDLKKPNEVLEEATKTEDPKKPNEVPEEAAKMDETVALNTLKQGLPEAEKLLKDKDKLERFLQRLEKKLKTVPLVGNKLAAVPIMASLLKSYVKKEYQDVPIGTILAVISALMYFVSPIDIVPDSIPVLGYFDDAAVVVACWTFVESDLDEYCRWREKNHKVITD